MAKFSETSVDRLWERLLSRRVFGVTTIDLSTCERICPGDRERILRQADRAMRHRVQLLGSAEQDLGEVIDWHSDFKVGATWAPKFFRDIDYANLDRPSDVKVPWELSRMQWVVPLGMAFVCDGDERYSAEARRIVTQWIRSNPCGFSVNWTCTMEAAMRVVVWTWLFEVFGGSKEWSDGAFRSLFLKSLWQHVDFTDRHIERSDINGNHFTADAVALVVGGLLFGESKQGAAWRDLGRAELEREMPLQVFGDGVDYEASVPYHRLVLELFFTAAFCLKRAGSEISGIYESRLRAMARFVAAYSRIDGTSPYWGDADDARVLPFGDQRLEDHRYLIGLVGLLLNDERLIRLHSGSRCEALWWFGAAADKLQPIAHEQPGSTAFAEGGVFILRNCIDHIFVDCGPIGLGGRGGHGHNDCLSFEAMLAGQLLIRDSGSFVYTADPAARNRFRGTSMHNTPMVDDVEINSFPSPDNLWQLNEEAIPAQVSWEFSESHDLWNGGHQGYRKLPGKVDVQRSIRLDHAPHSLTVQDELHGDGVHRICIPLQLAVGVDFEQVDDDSGLLKINGRRFGIRWESSVRWTMTLTVSSVSPSYGVLTSVNRLEWRREGVLPCSLTVIITTDHQVIS